MTKTQLIFPTLLAGVLMPLLSGCARYDGPDEHHIKEAWEQQLPEWVSLIDVQIEAREKRGTEVHPEWLARVTGDIQFEEHTYTVGGGSIRKQSP